jgi:hypothetical protein
MKTDLRDERVASLLDRAVDHVEPDPERGLPSIRRRGAARRGVRWIAVGAGLAVFLGALGWAAFELPRQRTTSPAGQASEGEITIPWADATLSLPSGWYGRSVQSDNIAALFATTRLEAVVGGAVIRGCGPGEPSCSINALNLTKLGRSDAYIQVFGGYVPIIDAPIIDGALPVMPLPRLVLPSAFRQVRTWQDQPVMQLTGRGSDRGIYQITYWIGPEASGATRAGIGVILAGLHLPTAAISIP